MRGDRDTSQQGRKRKRGRAQKFDEVRQDHPGNGRAHRCDEDEFVCIGPIGEQAFSLKGTNATERDKRQDSAAIGVHSQTSHDSNGDAIAVSADSDIGTGQTANQVPENGQGTEKADPPNDRGDAKNDQH
jgi:hypothetical protein